MARAGLVVEQARRPDKARRKRELRPSVQVRLEQPELVSILILTRNDAATIRPLLGRVTDTLSGARVPFEIVLVDAGSTDGTVEAAEAQGARVLRREGCGFGEALRQGLGACRGAFTITVDATLSHHPMLLLDLLAERAHADIVIASRYVQFGHARMPWIRRVLSRMLNRVFRVVLDVPVRDLSSGFRLYRMSSLSSMALQGRHVDVLPEVVVLAYAQGYRIREIPFHYRADRMGRPAGWLIAFGWAYLKTLRRCWAIRNSIASADYDFRAFHARNPVQRYWQRRRYAIIVGYAGEYRAGLDVGCGSSAIIDALPKVAALDVSLPKLRFLRGHTARPLACGDIRALPFGDQAFDLLINSEVIEHVPRDGRIFTELRRVLRPGGTLILGTPDYSRRRWRMIEWLYKRVAPGAYGDEHITRYDARQLRELLAEQGFEIQEQRYICGAELIIRARRVG